MKATALIVVLAAATALAGEPACPDTSQDRPLLAHADCNKFYVCANGEPIEQRCSANLHFNPESQQCDYPENVECGGRKPEPNPEETNPKVVPEEGEQEEETPETNPEENGPPAEQSCLESEHGNLYNHLDFDKFYQCSYLFLVELNCPPGLIFNGKLGWCDWPENVQESDEREFYPVTAPPQTSAPAGTNPENNGPPAEQSCLESEHGNLYNHLNFDKFYQCSYLFLVELNCPPGLIFNGNLGWCDWPENVQESNEREFYPVTAPPQTSAPAGTNPENNGPAAELSCLNDGEILNHPDCDKYYVCSFGIPVVQSCPAGLLYNYRLQWCDWPENVNCEDVPKPAPPQESSEEPAETSPEEGGPPTAVSCTASDPEVYHINDEECNRYYRCINGFLVEQVCPDGLNWSQPMQRCDWPWNVICGDRNNLYNTSL